MHSFAVAEAGVYKGDFAKVINEYFPNSRLYLFDTFEGFLREDLEKESENKLEMAGRFGDTSEELVLDKMRYPEKVVIKKGIFPTTAIGIEDRFAFVNLDMDLEYPTVQGLDFFSERMVESGVILVHDYFSQYYTGIKISVDRWLMTHEEFRGYPIGDDMSIMIIRR